MTGLQVNAATAPSALASQAGASLPWTQATDTPWFPTGGVMLMLVLLAVAAWAWWAGPQRRPGQRGWPWFARRRLAKLPNEPEIVTATRLDARTNLYVIRWHDCELLLGVTGHAAPVVLHRQALSSAQGQS